MKKIITLFFTIVTLGYAEVGDYKSEFGVGVGLGIPSGYEFKGIYRYNEWLSLSLNYNSHIVKLIATFLPNELQMVSSSLSTFLALN